MRIKAQRRGSNAAMRVRKLLARMNSNGNGESAAEHLDLSAVAHALIKKDVWIVGGDGWAYDIGYGGLRSRIRIQPQRKYSGP